MLRLCLSAVVALAGAGAAASAAHADGRLEARYRMSIAGLELGRAAFLLEVDQDSYTASGSARLTGVVRAVSSAKGSAGARGLVENGELAPRSFAMEAETDKKSEAIRLALNGAGVTDMSVEPPVSQSEDRVPVTDKDKKGVFDPMTAALIMVPGSDDPLSPKACDRTLSIFDGRQRYNLELSYERMEDVKAEKGYAGPSVVCRIAYRPVAGHRPSRKAVKYMTSNKEMYVWLVPVAGTRVLVPFRASVATAIGVAQLEAQSFVSEPMVGKGPRPSRAAAP
ncbi:DUF3108 domain-containing protein [Ancylobacter mangrovi]|uniref:DUF3108 domain-containing protein n=1 Tax=Ancylobacter mangrovi TaxID=2972472 RepID=UPI00216307DF|nr:DUF3108 domain-containing protein [Ancylobacter mangrovi]MCS0504841.1 DUF3108 domain-containing protein [Ancylobacter mangrovi]